VPAFDDVKSVSRRKMKNGSEWYLKRLTENGTYRPISGWKETQAYHRKVYGDKDYYSFELLPCTKVGKVNTVEVDDTKDEPGSDSGTTYTSVYNTFTQWMELAVECKAEYVILTAKHHDGWCLFNTSTTHRNCVTQAPHINLLKLFTEIARTYGLKVGVYYSWMEFGKGVTKAFIKDTIDPQMRELIEYDIDLWWFDGDWACTTQYAKEYVRRIVKSLKGEVNDRVCLVDTGTGNFNDIGCSTFRVYEDRFLPAYTPTLPWQHINTIGDSWGRNKQQNKYKSGDELYKLYTEVTSKRGSFLLNLGPDENGILDEQEVASLKRLNELIKSEV
jgi:alpha-L-fucosidase